MEDSDGVLIIGVDPDNKELPIALFWDDGSEDAFGMTLDDAKHFATALLRAIEDVESSQAKKH